MHSRILDDKTREEEEERAASRVMTHTCERNSRETKGSVSSFLLSKLQETKVFLTKYFPMTHTAIHRDIIVFK